MGIHPAERTGLNELLVLQKIAYVQDYSCKRPGS